MMDGRRLVVPTGRGPPIGVVGKDGDPKPRHRGCWWGRPLWPLSVSAQAGLIPRHVPNTQAAGQWRVQAGTLVRLPYPAADCAAWCEDDVTAALQGALHFPARAHCWLAGVPVRRLFLRAWKLGSAFRAALGTTTISPPPFSRRHRGAGDLAVPGESCATAAPFCSGPVHLGSCPAHQGVSPDRRRPCLAAVEVWEVSI